MKWGIFPTHLAIWCTFFSLSWNIDCLAFNYSVNILSVSVRCVRFSLLFYSFPVYPFPSVTLFLRKLYLYILINILFVISFHSFIHNQFINGCAEKIRTYPRLQQFYLHSGLLPHLFAPFSSLIANVFHSQLVFNVQKSAFIFHNLPFLLRKCVCVCARQKGVSKVLRFSVLPSEMCKAKWKLFYQKTVFVVWIEWNGETDFLFLCVSNFVRKVKKTNLSHYVWSMLTLMLFTAHFKRTQEYSNTWAPARHVLLITQNHSKLKVNAMRLNNLYRRCSKNVYLVWFCGNSAWVWVHTPPHMTKWTEHRVHLKAY